MTDERCGYEATNGPCSNPATESDGYCWLESHGDPAVDSESDGRGAPEGNENAADHYAFSDKFREDLTESENEALDALMTHLSGITDERTLAAEVVGEALLKYKRTGDSRFLREARQWMADFNLLPNEDEVNIGGSDGGALNVIVNREAYDGDE